MFTRISRRFVDISDDALMYILFTLFGVAVGISLTSYFFSQGANLLAWFDSFFQNFGTEMFGAFLTFWLIEMLRGSRRERERAAQERERAVQERKARLIRQMGSNVRGVAGPAVEELRVVGWLTDGSLKGAGLDGANLQGAHLYRANLEGAELNEANLEEASLIKANLAEARLKEANLQGADLHEANLRDANLSWTNLQKAALFRANLQGADLWKANLQDAGLFLANLQDAGLFLANLQDAGLFGANLQGAKEVTCDQLREAITLEGVTLPDGTKLPGRTFGQMRAGEPEPPWREEFEAWCETVETDEDGFIVPAEIDDEND